MNTQTTEKTCPIWMGYGLRAGIRKWVHNPAKMTGKFIRPGMTVADIGTGMGYMTIPMAEMVGKNGKVIAVDIQEEMLLKLLKTAKRKNVDNQIVPVLSQQKSLMLEQYAESLDFALLFMMVHEVSNREKLFSDLAKAMKPGGLVMMAEPAVHVGKQNFQESIHMAEKNGFVISEQKQSVFICRTVILQKTI